MSMNEVVKKLSQAIDKQADKAKTTAYDTPATVRRIEGDTAWVHIPGGVDETPVKLTISAKEGDQVQVRVSGGSAFMVGNGTNPPTDDARANEAYAVAGDAIDSATMARTAALTAEASAASAQSAAASAQADAAIAKATTDEINNYADSVSKTVTQVLADGETAGAAAQAATEAADSALYGLSTVEDVVGVLNWITAHGTMTLTSDVTVNPAHVYFVVDPAGDYVVGGTHYSIVSEPKDAELSTYYELTVDESVQNYVATHIAVDSEGLWLIPEDNATIASSSKKILIAVGGAGHTYSTAGTYIIQKVNGTDTVFAKFTADGATMQAEGSTQIAHLGYGPGYDDEGQLTDAPYFSFGERSEGEPYDSTETYYIGAVAKYNGVSYVCNTAINTPEQWNPAHWQRIIGGYSTTEGIDATASGFCSHSEGDHSSAIDYGAHAEGVGSVAAGYAAHSEGNGSRAISNYAHAEGNSCWAVGLASHAEGNSSESYGEFSHAQNLNTVASRRSQTVIGENNVWDTAGADETERGDYALIIGNGTADNARSNALTVDWNGNVDIASGAKYKINGTDLAASDVGAEPTLTNINESGGTYSGGIEDEKLLTTATITKWQTILGIS